MVVVWNPATLLALPPVSSFSTMPAVTPKFERTHAQQAVALFFDNGGVEAQEKALPRDAQFVERHCA
jgi:hypothetical protein